MAASAHNVISKEVENRFFRESSHQSCSAKGVTKNFAKFTGKLLCRSLFFNIVAGLVLQLYEKETPTQVFSCEFCKFFKNTFLTEHL